MKEHQFFRDIDWQQVYMQKYTPPLTPPRGEVNAADAFDIGSFDEEDTKGYKVHPSWISNFFKVVLVSSNLSLSLFPIPLSIRNILRFFKKNLAWFIHF